MSNSLSLLKIFQIYRNKSKVQSTTYYNNCDIMSARQSDDDEDPPSVGSDTLGGDQEQQPQVEMGQQLILSRLGQEEGLDTDSQDQAPARINFGMKVKLCVSR